MSGIHNSSLLDDLRKALGVARRYLRMSLLAINVHHGEKWREDASPADDTQVIETARSVLNRLASGEHVECVDDGNRLGADGQEYLTTLSESTPDQLVEIAAYAIISSVLLRAEADEATRRAIVALGMASDSTT